MRHHPRRRPGGTALETLEPRRLLADVGIALDTTFGDGGRVLLDVSPRDTVYDAELLPDGRFVLVGATGEADVGSGWRAQGLVVRFNPDGTPDTTFAGDGVATVPTGWSDGHLVFNAVLPLSDGKVLAGGYRTRPVPSPTPIPRDVVLARFNADGTPDATFGDNGVVYAVPQAQLSDMVVLPDGTILGGGYRMSADESNPLAALWRFNPDGSLDPTFGDGGQVIHGTPGGLMRVDRLLPPVDGIVSAVVAGHLAQFRMDGSLVRPVEVTQLYVYPQSLTQLADGRVLFARDATPVGGGFNVIRLLPDGVTPDPSFDASTVHSAGSGPTFPSGIAVTPDGMVLVTVERRSTIENDPYTYGSLLRLLPDGRPDPSVPAAAAHAMVVSGPMLPFVSGAREVTVVGTTMVNPYPQPYGLHDVVLDRFELDPPLDVDPGAYAVDEGGAINATASAAYVGGEVASYEWDANYNGFSFTPDATGPAARIVIPDDDPAPRLVLRVTTSDGLAALVPVGLTVRNVAPVITRLSVPDLVVKGVAAPVTATFADPGADQWQATFRFSDDGSTVNALPTGSKNFGTTHAFARGKYTVTAAVSDDDGGSGSLSASGRAVDVLGTVYKDAGDDGRLDAIDRPWPGVEVYLDRDDDGVADEGEERSVTDTLGRYWFSGLSDGTHAVRLVTTPAGWRFSGPATGRGAAAVTATRGARVDFGLSQRGRITGTVFNDANLNGVRDAGENALTGGGALPFVDLDNDGRWDPHEPQASFTAGPGGRYVIQNLLPGTYTVRYTMEQPPNWVVTGPAARAGHTVTVAAAQTAGDYDFGRGTSPVTLSGSVYYDTDGDGVRDNNEAITTTGGWVVYLDADDDGVLDPDEQRTDTGTPGGFNNGTWRMGVMPGPYVLRMVPRDGRTVTGPAGGAIRGTAAAGQVGQLNFGYQNTGPRGFVGAHLFYENSGYDAQEPSFHVDAADAAVIPGKQPFGPGQRGSFANVSPYSRGLNGILVDLVELAGSGPTFQDFAVHYNDGRVAANWRPAQLPHLAVRRGDGAGGTDRVEITYPDNGVIRNAWVRVQVAANARTGLTSPRVFYFGHLTGNVVGGGASELAVDARDLAAVRRRAATFAAQYGEAVITKTGVIDPMDVNADGLVDQADVLIVRSNVGRRLAPLAAPAAAPPQPATLAAIRLRRAAEYVLI